MATKKGVKTKKMAIKIPAVAEAIEEKEDGELDIIPVKGKVVKPIEIDTVDILGDTDEKVIDEEAATLALEEEDEDVPSLDREDLNPFGDKWEE